MEMNTPGSFLRNSNPRKVRFQATSQSLSPRLSSLGFISGRDVG